jgi:hypothetical protein
MREPHVPLGQHRSGRRLEVLGHACPDCPVGQPRPFCPSCLGAGILTSAELAVWQARHLAQANV